VFETVCASSLEMCAYQISEHLHLTFADHLDLYSQQANPNFLFPVLEGGSNPISPFVCLSTLLSLASERHFWL
jgi:hypothetical protein